MAENIIQAKDDTFENEVLKADKPVLVDFWADWCGPCKSIAPILEEVAEEYKGKVKVVKVDIDANKETPAKYEVRGIPTLILFKKGERVAEKVGALSKPQLIEFVDENL